MLELINNPLLLLVYLAALLTAITVHEFAHAKAADYLGDPTPGLQGRLSLNPFVHLDMIGILFLFMFGFGWGKPVQFDPFNLKNPRKDAAIISFAGPLSNFILAVLLALIARINFGLAAILLPFVQLNIMLGVFNLIPVHPLDGFKIIGGLLSREQAKQWYQLERYGFIFLLLLIIPIGSRSMISAVISPAIGFLMNVLLPPSAMGVSTL